MLRTQINPRCISALALLAVLMGLALTGCNRRARAPDDPYAAGREALAAGRWDQAIAHLQAACERDVGCRDAEKKLAQALDDTVTRR